MRLAAEQRMAPAVQQYLQQQQAAAPQRQNRSKEASAKAIASLRRFTATKEWIVEKGNPECVITAEGTYTTGLQGGRNPGLFSAMSCIRVPHNSTAYADFKAGDNVIEMPCHHVFQPQALEHWLAQVREQFGHGSDNIPYSPAALQALPLAEPYLPNLPA